MRCPDCGEYSLTYDFERHGFVCHIYNGFIPAEDMPGELGVIGRRVSAAMEMFATLLNSIIPKVDASKLWL